MSTCSLNLEERVSRQSLSLSYPRPAHAAGGCEPFNGIERTEAALSTCWAVLGWFVDVGSELTVGSDEVAAEAWIWCEVGIGAL